MDSQRYLRCLGQPALFTPTGEPIRFRTRKHLALLVYLAVEGRSHRRDRLAELLWPKVSTTEARHSLATALSILRPRLGLDGLESSRDHVRLMPGRVILDLERLQSGDVLGSEVSGPLEVAAFLDGFDIADSAEFTHWKDRQQARLLPVIKDALLVLIGRCRRMGDTRQIEQLADRMLALDELSEEAIRAKMEARAFAGDRLTALEIFEAWRKKLAEELQAAPSDLVEGMAVRLRRRGWERTTLANIPNVPTDHWRGRPFIGRTAEYRVLYELWEGVQKGVPGHALVLGDSGVGKTTLVQRLATAAGLEGAAISRVQCYDVEREIPYSTLSGLIIGLLDWPGVSATSPEALAELSGTVSLLHHRFPNLPSIIESQGESARIRLTEAFHEMLTAIADEHPVVLVIDDLHLADDVSLAVLHLILRRARGQLIMVVLVARPGELHQSPQAERLRESITALGIHEVTLTPLGDQESREMLCSLLEQNHAKPSTSEERALLRAAAGYPMAIELLVQDWNVNRQHSLALSVGAMTTDFSADQPAQAYYRQILGTITRSLDSTTQNVLNLASVLGQRLNDLNLYALMDLSAGQTMGSMAELVKRRVLRDGAQGLEFVNELLRGAAYLGVPQALRRVLHAKIADRFIGKHESGDDDIGLEIAWHCIRAGRMREATQYLLSGARESIRKGALHAAERALSSAIPHLTPSERSDAVFLLVEVLQEQGRWRDSLDILHTSTELSKEAWTVFSICAQHWLNASTPEQTQIDLGHLRSVIESPCDGHLRLKAARIAASLNSRLRDPQIARVLLQSVSTIPVPTNADGLARLSDCKGQLLYHAFERGSSLNEIAQFTEQLADGHLVNSTMASLHTGLGVLACSEGKYAKAKNDFRRAYDISIRLGNDSVAGTTAAQLALCCYRLGEYHEGIEWGEPTNRLCSQLTFGGFLECQYARHTGMCYALLGIERAALETIEKLELRMPKLSPTWMTQAWGLSKADILLYLGDEYTALAAAESAIGKADPVLYDRGFAGAFARWVSLITKRMYREDIGRSKVEHLAKDLMQLDALDQLEVLCARLMLFNGLSKASMDLAISIQTRLTSLPLAVSDQLRRLGFLSASGINANHS